MGIIFVIVAVMLNSIKKGIPEGVVDIYILLASRIIEDEDSMANLS